MTDAETPEQPGWKFTHCYTARPDIDQQPKDTGCVAKLTFFNPAVNAANLRPLSATVADQLRRELIDAAKSVPQDELDELNVKRLDMTEAIRDLEAQRYAAQVEAQELFKANKNPAKSEMKAKSLQIDIDTLNNRLPAVDEMIAEARDKYRDRVAKAVEAKLIEFTRSAHKEFCKLETEVNTFINERLIELKRSWLLWSLFSQESRRKILLDPI